jgi:hypothetical protein
MQDILAISIVAVSAAFLMRRAWQRLAHRSGGTCGSCADCGSHGSQQLISISPDLSHAEAQRREEMSL